MAEQNKEKVDKRNKEWDKNNPNYQKNYAQRPKVKAKRSKRDKERRRTDVSFKINEVMSGAIRRCLMNNKGGEHWEMLVDYTLKDLTTHTKIIW